MNSRKKANLLVFLIIAIIAFGLSSVIANLTPNIIPMNFTSNNDSDKLIEIENDSFKPTKIKQVQIIIENKTNPLINNTTNITNNTDEPIININKTFNGFTSRGY